MALMESTMVPLGTACPDFTLPGVDGRLWSLHDFHCPALLVVVMCNHCPYVQAIDDRLQIAPPPSGHGWGRIADQDRARDALAAGRAGAFWAGLAGWRVHVT